MILFTFIKKHLYKFVLTITLFLQIGKNPHAFHAVTPFILFGPNVSTNPRSTTFQFNTLNDLGLSTLKRYPVSLESFVSDSDLDVKPCYYKAGDEWKQRDLLDNLTPGQEITGIRIPNADLLGGKTGPKIFFECGVGRIDHKGDWQMVSGMLRLGRRGQKISLTKKKLKKLSGKTVTLYVHKIQSANGRLEVCSSLDDLERRQIKEKNLVPASSLNIGQEFVGTVTDVRSYGCIVDISANRKGLLHIQKVADLFGKYIDKEEGLIQSGLERGAKLKVSVLSNDKKRLFLDFSQEVKEESSASRIDAGKKAKLKTVDIIKEETTNIETKLSPQVEPEVSEEEAFAWASYAADYENYDDDDDNFDEDRDIEDALGMGSY